MINKFKCTCGHKAVRHNDILLKLQVRGRDTSLWKDAWCDQCNLMPISKQVGKYKPSHVFTPDTLQYLEKVYNDKHK